MIKKVYIFLFSLSILSIGLISSAFAVQNVTGENGNVSPRVKNVSVKEKGEDSVTLRWKKVEESDYYQIRLMNKHKKKLDILRAEKKTKTINELTPRKVYKVRVRAVIGEEKGKWSKILKFKTKAAEEEELDTENDTELEDDEMDETDDGDSGVTVFTISMRDFKSNPQNITVNLNDTVRLKITSEDIPYTLSMPEFDINELLPAGEETVVEFVADLQGGFNFFFFCNEYCDSQFTTMRGDFIVQ